jgi:hypothetical protein
LTICAHCELVIVPGLLTRPWNFFIRLGRLIPSAAWGASASAISWGWIISGAWVGGRDPLGVAVPVLGARFASHGVSTFRGQGESTCGLTAWSRAAGPRTRGRAARPHSRLDLELLFELCAGVRALAGSGLTVTHGSAQLFGPPGDRRAPAAGDNSCPGNLDLLADCLVVARLGHVGRAGPLQLALLERIDRSLLAGWCRIALRVRPRGTLVFLAGFLALLVLFLRLLIRLLVRLGGLDRVNGDYAERTTTFGLTDSSVKGLFSSDPDSRSS